MIETENTLKFISGDNDDHSWYQVLGTESKFYVQNKFYARDNKESDEMKLQTMEDSFPKLSEDEIGRQYFTFRFTTASKIFYDPIVGTSVPLALVVATTSIPSSSGFCVGNNCKTRTSSPGSSALYSHHDYLETLESALDSLNAIRNDSDQLNVLVSYYLYI